MAIVREMDYAAFNAWAASRPECVRALIQRLPPDRLYMLKTSHHRVTIYSYSEDGTVTVDVSGKYNLVLFRRQVFGVNPDDLVECELPSPDEPVGEIAAEAGYTDDDIKNILIPRLREQREGE